MVRLLIMVIPIFNSYTFLHLKYVSLHNETRRLYFLVINDSTTINLISIRFFIRGNHMDEDDELCCFYDEFRQTF